MQTGMPHDDRFQNAKFVKLIVVLFQNRQPLAGGNNHLAGSWFDFTGQYFEKSRFARSVGADQSITVAWREFDVDIFEQSAFPILESEVLGTDHILIPNFLH